jgi:hypothetical protein
VAVQPGKSEKFSTRCKLRHKMNLNMRQFSLASRGRLLSARRFFCACFAIFLAWSTLAVIVASGLVVPVFAQSAPATAIGEARKFPEKTKLGELIVGVFPEVMLNGQNGRFSASGRLINLTNMIVVPSSVYQKTMLVRYELDVQGNIQRAWLLNPVELKIAQEEARKNP